jgi:diguanylate cyclase (GGDEF)-like protein
MGATYFLPLYFLYRISIQRLFTLMFYTWTYTLLINSFSFGVVHLLNIQEVEMFVLIIQTILLLISLRFIIRFSTKKFKDVIEKANPSNQYHLMLLGIAIFLISAGIRYYISPENAIFLVLVTLMMVIGITSYALLDAIVQSNLSLSSAKSIASTDALTGINNQYALFNDLGDLSQKNDPYLLLFLDLDNFKDVNDTCDHSMGDQYLKHFASLLTSAINPYGNAYRYAGDEFICLVTTSLETFDLSHFRTLITKGMDDVFQFRGVSIGMAYPTHGLDPNSLINHADRAMYEEKRHKKMTT